MTVEERNQRTYENFTMVRALQELDESKAIELMGTPELCGEELSDIIEASIMGYIVNKETGEPSKLSTKVMQAAMINKVDQLHNGMK